VSRVKFILELLLGVFSGPAGANYFLLLRGFFCIVTDVTCCG
jgi:hypothetical protein